MNTYYIYIYISEKNVLLSFSLTRICSRHLLSLLRSTCDSATSNVEITSEETFPGNDGPNEEGWSAGRGQTAFGDFRKTLLPPRPRAKTTVFQKIFSQKSALIKNKNKKFSLSNLTILVKTLTMKTSRKKLYYLIAAH
ncbi:hypothetical protein EGR_09099 [Echinococcus granulosus]|uniref:Uncharacterized protein n=1 Tax=Echinococcus granulosus TaxID=6210 RepID=W6URL0_ECHGR|nr:hypothetical protein EGR_09099 [Echinococcus granulosus]EUB56019.1 hypothetical protein EGR_09099 [Echinococcus granulosus]